jgi:hypothetical protein
MRLAVVLAVAVVIAACSGPVPTTSPSPTSARTVPCGPTERFERHAHAHLTLVIRGQLRPVPANIGITSTEICWLHTHDSSGIIHIEAGDARTFTLGDFFAVWRQPLDSTVIGGDRVNEGESVRSVENRRDHSGSPGTIVLDDKDDVVLYLGPPFPTVAPYVWPPGY